MNSSDVRNLLVAYLSSLDLGMDQLLKIKPTLRIAVVVVGIVTILSSENKVILVKKIFYQDFGRRVSRKIFSSSSSPFFLLVFIFNLLDGFGSMLELSSLPKLSCLIENLNAVEFVLFYIGPLLDNFLHSIKDPIFFSKLLLLRYL